MTDSRKRYEAWHAALPVDLAVEAPWHLLVLAHLNPTDDLQDRDVLELACGRGGFARHLVTLARPRRLVAEDFATAAVRMGHAAGTRLRGLHWVGGDAQALPHPDASFDTIISCETIEHVPDPGQAVREFARVLRPGGRLFLTTPNYLGGFGVYRLYRWATRRPYTEEGQPINHVMHWFRIVRALRRAGLRARVLDGIGHYLPIPRRAPLRLLTLDGMRWLTRWTALHAFVLAEKP